MTATGRRRCIDGDWPDRGRCRGRTRANRQPRMGFFTDTSLCIGCKACEVACKEWNGVPEDGLDFTGDVLRQHRRARRRHLAARGVHRAGREPPGRGGPGHAERAAGGAEADREVRWLMASDVCKHCTHAACLDVCPTGALFRTEFGTVVVQEDSATAAATASRRARSASSTSARTTAGPGSARSATTGSAGLEPACAKACPTDSIQFGPLDELRERAAGRVDELHEAGVAAGPALRRRPDDGVGGAARSSCCSTSPRSTGCRRTRW